VAQWGTGGLNIDGCRVGDEVLSEQKAGQAKIGTFERHNMTTPQRVGRWPANVILDEEAAAALDAQSGVGGISARKNKKPYSAPSQGVYGNYGESPKPGGYSDSGGASRFFYTAKASRSEREAGLDGVEQIKAGAMTGAEYREDRPTNHPMRANHHPTVKPIALMRYMIRLVVPRGAVVLDPFMGSGSTGCAAMIEGMQFVGIDITPEYVDIARRRIAWWSASSPLDNTATMELHEESDV
jgi:site-specific DNA-methyltransferase (adenine-specific)